MMQRYTKTRAGLLSFTLIELLLVIVLVCITLGIAMPSFVRSIRSNRLHTAARTLVTVARYARSMTLLKQTSLSVKFNVDTGQIDLVSTNTAVPRFTRVVKGVCLAYVDIEGSDAPYTEGTCTVPYSRNGICKPFSAKIMDTFGNYVIVKIDALSSAKTMEFGGQ